MYVHEQTRPVPSTIPGVAHATWSGQPTGARQLSVWSQSLAPAAATPPHRHDCEEVIFCSGGTGELHIDGGVHRFCAGSLVTVPRDAMHQIFNVGPGPLEMTAVLAATPVAVYLPDGSELPLPWSS
jgi:quercetin dioxygenase-like cupin family protein